MAVTEGFLPVGVSGKQLDTTVITQSDGSTPAHREAVFLADPENTNARGKVTNAVPGSTDYGPVTRPILDGQSLGEGDITGETLRVHGHGSFIESDSTDMDATAVRATALTTANMHRIVSVPVQAAVNRSIDNPYRGRIEFPLVRGDYLIVSCTASTAVADVTVELGEQI